MVFLFLVPKYYVIQSAKTNLNVEEVFFSIARDIKQRLAESDSKSAEVCPLFSNYLFYYYFLHSLLLFLKALIFFHPKWVVTVFCFDIPASDN